MLTGLIVYIIFFIVSYTLIFGGVIRCNVLVTTGPGVENNILCVPILTLAGIPYVAVGEVVEDISSGTVTNMGLYLYLIGSMVIYFGSFALGGYLYGKHKNKVSLYS